MQLVIGELSKDPPVDTCPHLSQQDIGGNAIHPGTEQDSCHLEPLVPTAQCSLGLCPTVDTSQPQPSMTVILEVISSAWGTDRRSLPAKTNL